MKMNKLIVSAALALAGVTFLQIASADEPDLILGFQTAGATGSSINYEVDLGSALQFTSLENTGAQISLSGTGTAGYGAISVTALQADYGSGTSWTTDGVQFGVAGTFNVGVGTSAQTNEYYITDASLTNLPARQPNEAGGSDAIDNLYTGYDDGTTTAGTNAVNVATSINGSYTSVAGANGNYSNSFSYLTQANIPSSGTVSLNLYDAAQGSSGTPATLVGTFTLDSSGDLSFTATAASVPEPSTYALLAIGALGAFLVSRRRSMKA
jgi:hypothetical protein